MLVEVTFLNERARANVADKGFLSRMSPDVVGEDLISGLHCKGTMAHWADFVDGTVSYHVLGELI